MLFFPLLFAVVVGQNSQTYQFPLGDFDCMVISDGLDQTIGLQGFYPDFPEEILAEKMRQNGYVGIMSIYFNVILCDTGDNVVLIDAGTEKRWGPETTGLLHNNMLSLGYDPVNVTDVIVTHGHTDHFGGLLSLNNETVYPNANVWVPQVDYEFYTDEANSHLDDYENFNIVFLGLEDAGINVIHYTAGVLFEGFEALDFSGHTPGAHVIKIFSGNDSFYFVGDTTHTEVPISNPYWQVVYDIDRDKAVNSRVELLNRLADENAFIAGYHINFPGLGFVRRDGYAFQWVTAQWQF